VHLTKKGMSKREKIMILAVVFFAVTVGIIMYIIIPLNEHLNERRSEYQTLSNEKFNIEMLLRAEAANQEHHITAALNYENINERFLRESHLNGIGRMLTNLVHSFNLRALDQRLSPPSVSSESSIFLISQSSMTVSGTFDNLMEFLDYIYKMEYLRVTNIIFMVRELYETWEGVSIQFEITMIRDRM